MLDHLRQEGHEVVVAIRDNRTEEYRRIPVHIRGFISDDDEFVIPFGTEYNAETISRLLTGMLTAEDGDDD